MTIDYVLWIALIARCVGTFGFQTCSEERATSEAREEAPLVGVVEDVNMVSDGGLIGGDPDTYLQIDDEIYKYISEIPSPPRVRSSSTASSMLRRLTSGTRMLGTVESPWRVRTTR